MASSTIKKVSPKDLMYKNTTAALHVDQWEVFLCIVSHPYSSSDATYGACGGFLIINRGSADLGWQPRVTNMTNGLVTTSWNATTEEISFTLASNAEIRIFKLS